MLWKSPASVFLLVFLLGLGGLALRAALRRRRPRTEPGAPKVPDALDRRLALSERISRTGGFELDPVTGELWVSQGMRRLLGRGADEPLQISHLLDLVHPEDRARCLATVKAHRQRTKPFEFECRVVRPDGQVRNLTFRLETHESLLVGAGQDVSQERKGREELEQTRILLAQAQKMEAVGRLAGGMAHDFNNLLAVIQGNCSLLIEEVHDNDEAVDLLSQVLGASQRGACLTRQLLTFSRCHRKQWGRFDLNEALTEFVPMLCPLLGDKVRLALDCAPELLPLQGDRGHLEQVVLSLVLNARDAMPTGGDLTLRTLSFTTDLPVRCRSCQLGPGEYLAVEVTDSGCGMSAETQRRLFEPFFTTRGDGTGLGLATAFGLVADLKGGFQVESQPGRGSIFRLILPRLLETASTAVETELPREPEALEGCKVLLVEDLPDLRRLLDRLLRGRGFHVVSAGSGEEAEELFPLVEPRIVVSDLMLPGVNGVELAHRLAARDPCLRVLLMSGYGAELDPAGFPFMSKPFTPDQLVRRLQEVLAA